MSTVSRVTLWLAKVSNVKIDFGLDHRISALTNREWVTGLVCYTVGKNSRNKEMAGEAGGFSEVFFFSFKGIMVIPVSLCILCLWLCHLKAVFSS